MSVKSKRINNMQLIKNDPKSGTYAETSHANTFCAHILHRRTCICAHAQKHPHILLRATPGEHPADSLNECFSSSPASEQLYRCCLGTFAVDNNVLYQQKLIIILFWYSYIACRGAISFLIKTNCLSLTSTEFFLQLSDKNKYVFILPSRSPSLLSSVSAHVCVCLCVCGVHLKKSDVLHVRW